MKTSLKITILSYGFVLAIAIILVTLPAFIGWDEKDIWPKIFYSAAASLLAAVLLAAMTKWVSQKHWDRVAEQISSDILISTTPKGLDTCGLVNIFPRRGNSLNLQDEIIKYENAFCFGLTFNSLMGGGRDTIGIITQCLQQESWRLKILIVNPLYYAGHPCIEDGESNYYKVIDRLTSLKGIEKSQGSLFSNSIDIRMTDTEPCYFIVGNDRKLLISFYDYQKGGTQPVLLFLNNGNKESIYQRYKKQFDDMFTSAESKSVKDHLNHLKKMKIVYDKNVMNQSNKLP